MTVLGFGSVIIAYLIAWVIVPKDVDVYGVSPAPGAAAAARLSPAEPLGGPRVADQQGRVRVVAEQPVDAGVQQHPDLGVDLLRPAGVVVADRPGQHLQPGQVRLARPGPAGPAAGSGPRPARRRTARPPAARRGCTGRRTSWGHRPPPGRPGRRWPRPAGPAAGRSGPAASAGWRSRRTGAPPRSRGGPGRGRAARRGRRPRAAARSRRGTTTTSARRAARSCGPSAGTPRPRSMSSSSKVAISSRPSQRVLRGRRSGSRSTARSVFSSASVRSSQNQPRTSRPPSSLTVRRSANSGCAGHVGGVAELRLVAQHGDAVRGHHQVGLDRLGAERDRQPVRRQRVLGPVAREHPGGRSPAAADLASHASTVRKRGDLDRGNDMNARVTGGVRLA